LNVSEASHEKNRKEKVFAAANNKDFRNFIRYKISHNRKKGKDYYSYAVTSDKYHAKAYAYAGVSAAFQSAGSDISRRVFQSRFCPKDSKPEACSRRIKNLAREEVS